MISRGPYDIIVRFWWFQLATPNTWLDGCEDYYFDYLGNPTHGLHLMYLYVQEVAKAT
jgi:hypothetical protein